MSFFGFDTSGQGKGAPGFSQAYDPFAGLANRQANADEAIDFEDTYDGLGDQLEETGDAFNDDTFGDTGGGAGGTTSTGKVGKDFDFFGQTAKVSNAIDEEHMAFDRHQPAPRHAAPAQQYSQGGPGYGYQQPVSAPVRTGYEKYQGMEPGRDLQVDAALWGVAPKLQSTPTMSALPPSAGRKILSLEEVEAEMRAHSQARKQSEPVAAAPPPMQQRGPELMQYIRGQTGQQGQHQSQNGRQEAQQQSFSAHGQPVQILQRPQSKARQTPTSGHENKEPVNTTQPGQPAQAPPQPRQPTQILRNPNRLSAETSNDKTTTPAPQVGAVAQPAPMPHHRSHSSISRQGPIITHPSQLAQMSEEDKTAFLEQEARRAKRNHKIYLLSRDNGLMTPSDKNFVTRIQLQQLVTATGNPAEHGTDASLDEDFYYQVHNQIRGGQRQNPAQPLNNFAQTYLFQTGGRHGNMRRNNRGPDNHMQRMEQQVQRAVEAAKNKPKNKQLVIEGSLGKISFSNAKTPKPLLNIKRVDSSSEVPRQSTPHKIPNPLAVLDRKAVLRDIEKVYSTLMHIEDHARKQPPPPPPPALQGGGPPSEEMVEWQTETQRLNDQLWRELKVHEPLGSTPVHPFIAMLELPKGKKAIPRVFAHTTTEQRTTILTMIIVHLDKLDVVRGASVTDGQVSLNAKMREEIERFSLAVSNTLFVFMGELGLDIIAGVLGLVSNLDVNLIARTRVGVGFLTMILSRAEIIVQSSGGKEGIKSQGGGSSLQNWESTYNDFFNIIEPTLPHIFPGTVMSGEDAYVWQLLAALGIGANADQQQRLVLAVKDRVLETVSVAKTLPADLAAQRLANVNLFMQAIGLDVSLLG